MNERIKISVVIIAYNQEIFVNRVLDSVLVQLDLIDEVVFMDDCSTDSTSQSVEAFIRNYGGKFKLVRNNINMGIFQNLKKGWSISTGDILFTIACDDVYDSNYFGFVRESIKVNQNIDYRQSLILSNCLVNKSGKIFYVKNYECETTETTSYQLRGLLHLYFAGIGKCITEKVDFDKLNFGIYSDAIVDLQIPILAKSILRLHSVIGGTYFEGIGVSKKIDHQQLLQLYKFLPNHFSLNSNDRRFLCLKGALVSFKNNCKIESLFVIIFSVFQLVWFFNLRMNYLLLKKYLIKFIRQKFF